MTSAPNLRQPSNGNKWLFLLILLIPLAYSCELFKPATGTTHKPPKDEDDIGELQGPVKVNPETGEFERVTTMTEPMDTMHWTINPPEKFPPITSETTAENSNAGSPHTLSGEVQYTTILLPFMTQQFSYSDTDIPKGSKRALQYYAGLKLALQDLQKDSVKLDLTILDSKYSEQEVNHLLSFEPSVQQAQMLIGTYRSANARLLAKYAKENQKPFVSPYSGSSNISEDNPYYVQVNPTLRTHCDAITKYVMQRYAPDQVILVVPDKPREIERLKIFQELRLQYLPKGDTTRFKELIISDESLDLKETDLVNHLLADRPTIFIVPSWSNETFVYAFLRKLKVAAQGFSEVMVFGMPQWMEYERADFELYENLNVHVSSNYYIDPYNPDIRNFKQRFFEEFGMLPQIDAYYGYCVTLYFLRLQQKYGKDFTQYLSNEDWTNLYTTYRFRPVFEQQTTGTETPARIQRYENKFVHILQFRDYYFQPAQ